MFQLVPSLSVAFKVVSAPFCLVPEEALTRGNGLGILDTAFDELENDRIQSHMLSKP